jgi:Acetyl-CoA hydrolase/transferase C-terminal domain
MTRLRKPFLTWPARPEPHSTFKTIESASIFARSRRQDIASYRNSKGRSRLRIDTHYVVTEFGSANLKGRSSTERAQALIGLAHQQFREELTAAAKKLNLI